jgi:hypothetical protein
MANIREAIELYVETLRDAGERFLQKQAKSSQRSKPFEVAKLPTDLSGRKVRRALERQGSRSCARRAAT